MGQHEKRIKELVLNRVAKCGQCGGDYAPPDVNVLGHKDDLWFLMLICGHCHQAVGVAAVVKEPSAAAGTEHLEREGHAGSTPRKRAVRSLPKASERETGEPVTAKDVSNIHDFLDGFDGDFGSLFRPEE